MRLISTQLSNALKSTQPINFSLYFNKMLTYHDDFFYKEMDRRKGQEIQKGKKISFKPCEGEKDGKRFRDDSGYGPARQHLPIYREAQKAAADILKQRHDQQARYIRAMEKTGWRSLTIRARLISPFVSGLGMSHPTETGLVLDHTSGMPYIPAAGQKGVLRVAHIINSLLDDMGEWLPEKELEKLEFIHRNKNNEFEWQEDKETFGKTFFGSGGEKDALAGQVVVLDAYPVTPPELGEEILNPHFINYYAGKRDPTEDQSPVPVKFLVVKRGAEFIFRVLLRLPLPKAPEKNQEKLARLLEKNLRRAICEEGFGAKTSLGFGRFEIISGEESETAVVPEKQAEIKNTLPNQDPAEQRHAKLETFHSGFPKLQDLPGRINVLIGRIELEEDETVRKNMCKMLLDLVKSDKKKLKKAIKDGKTWSKRLIEVCKSNGILVE